MRFRVLLIPSAIIGGLVACSSFSGSSSGDPSDAGLNADGSILDGARNDGSVAIDSGADATTEASVPTDANDGDDADDSAAQTCGTCESPPPCFVGSGVCSGTTCFYGTYAKPGAVCGGGGECDGNGHCLIDGGI